MISESDSPFHWSYKYRGLEFLMRKGHKGPRSPGFVRGEASAVGNAIQEHVKICREHNMLGHVLVEIYDKKPGFYVSIDREGNVKFPPGMTKDGTSSYPIRTKKPSKIYNFNNWVMEEYNRRNP